jgi:hypothetical protein
MTLVEKAWVGQLNVVLVVAPNIFFVNAQKVGYHIK